MSYIEGAEAIEEELYGCQVTTVHVRTQQAAEKLDKAVGSYITIETGEILSEHTKIEDVGECLAKILDRVLRPHYHGKLCICGMGKRDAPADALGPEVTQILPLRVLPMMDTNGNFSAVCSIVPGTEFTNNINTEVIVAGAVKEIGADCVLLIDSMITKDPERLFRTIHISSAGGITPYLAGRRADWSALDIPVISICVPMSIPLSALCQSMDDSLFTSIDVQSVIAAAGWLIAYAILRVCWPSMSKSECFAMLCLSKNFAPLSFLAKDGQEKAEPT